MPNLMDLSNRGISGGTVMYKRIMKFGIWGLAIAFVVGLSWYFFMADALVVFDVPERKAMGFKCDAEGLRGAETYLLEGNAVTNPSVHVAVHADCSNYDLKDQKIIFTADKGSITSDDVKLDFIAYDTLRIEYKRGFRILLNWTKLSSRTRY